MNFINPLERILRRQRLCNLLILGAILVLSFCLCFFGYRVELTPPVAIFRAISHFTLNSLDEDLPTNPGAFKMVLTGRWLAVAFFVLTAAALLQTAYHWIDTWFRRIRGRKPHDVVIGLGWKGRNLLHSRLPDARPCIAIDLNTSDRMAQSLSGKGISLVRGDATDDQVLQLAFLSDAVCIYVCTGSDDINIRVVQEISHLIINPNVVIAVELQCQRRYPVLKQSIKPDVIKDLRLFNTEAVTSRMLLQKHPLIQSGAWPSQSGAEVIVLGNNSLAREIVRQVMQQGVFEPDKTLSIHWLVSDPEQVRASFVNHYSCFVSDDTTGKMLAVPKEEIWSQGKANVLPNIAFHPLPVSRRSLLEALEDRGIISEKPSATSIYIVFEDPNRSAELAVLLAPNLARLFPGHDASLYFYFNTRDDRFCRYMQEAIATPHVFAFADFMGDCSMEVIRGDKLDTVARRVNGIYSFEGFKTWLGSVENHNNLKWQEAAASLDLASLVALASSGNDPDHLLQAFDLFCEEIWHEILEPDKESSRQAAAHAETKKRLRDQSPTTNLAEVEHRRWCVEQLLRGVRSLTRIPSAVSPYSPTQQESEDIASWFTDDKTLNKKKAFKQHLLHVDLVPFADFQVLFDASRAKKEEQKDREQILALDLLLHG